MASSNKNKSRLLKKELATLAKVIFKKYGKLFSVDTEPSDVILLLKFAAETKDVLVNSYLNSINQCLSPPHRKLFEQNGVDFSTFSQNPQPSIEETTPEPALVENKKTMVYRGQTILKDGPSSTREVLSKKSEESQEGKRKIIYRGKEKWI